MIQAKRRGLVDKIRETWKLYLLSDKPFHCTSSQWIHEFVEGGWVGGGGVGGGGTWELEEGADSSLLVCATVEVSGGNRDLFLTNKTIILLSRNQG